MHKIIYSLILLFIAFSGFAQQRDSEKEKGIEKQLEAVAPEYVDVFKHGTIAMDNNELHTADSLYSIVYEHAPSFDPVVRRLGAVKASLGRVNEGIALCEEALGLQHSSENIIMLVSCLIRPRDNNKEVLPVDLQQAMMLLHEGKNLPGSDELEYHTFIGQTALMLNDIYNFKASAELLKKKYSNQMITHYFAAIDAANDADWKTADREIRIAHRMGLSKEDMKSFLDAGITSNLEEISSEENRWATVIMLMWIILAWIGGFVLLYIVGRLLSFYTLRSIEQMNGAELQSGDKLRRIYRVLINSAGFYYYISLPLVLLLVIAIAAAIIYTFIIIGYLPIKIVLILVIGIGITIFGMLRSLFLKRDHTEPGRELKRDEAPELYALTQEVATTMGTRPIHEIRITPHTDLAVYETGTWREKLKDNGKRILIIGTGVLKDFKMNDFRAVLAHEYGHFSHRDTAGGGVALRVRNDMANYYNALYREGQAVWWNGAFIFLRFYHFVFHRISAGATRLQEVLADRVAAQTYGYQSFQNGLTFVIKRDIEFTMSVNSEIEDAENTKRPYNNLYELHDITSADVEKELTEALNRKTTEDDTHPSPVDRFRYVAGLEANCPVDDRKSVSDLFTDWNSITEEMTQSIKQIVSMNKSMN